MRSEEFRQVMAGVCKPGTIVTTTVGRVPHGTTVSAFISLSLDPPMVSAGVAADWGWACDFRTGGGACTRTR